MAVLLVGCAADHRDGDDRAPLVFAQVVVHCYRTLADPYCLAEPIPGEEARLIGVGVSGFHAVPAIGDAAPRRPEQRRSRERLRP